MPPFVFLEEIMARKRSELEQELMTDANIAKVIRLLEPSEEGAKPITKKDACQILGMAYNTTRLATVIEEYKDKREREKRFRAEKRGKPITQQERSYIVSEYLAGEPVDAISKSTYRSTAVIKQVLDECSVPIRVPGHSYFNPQLIPEGAVRDRFKIGEIVYSARYDTLAKITSEQHSVKHDCYIYSMWLKGNWQQNAYQPAYELASLEHLRELGVQI
jgi:hypothetical protein